MHKATATSLRAILAALAIMLLGGTVGCKLSPQSRQATEKEAHIRPEDVKISTEQFRLRMRSLVGPMCGQIEESADLIIAGTPDPNVKLAALEWKMEAVPAMREALFRPDPYSAAFDTAALCMQMTQYFERGPGKGLLGPAASAQAAAACRSMADEFIKVVATGTASGDVSKAREFVQRWAAEHPIRHSISDRESAMSRVFEQEFLDSRKASDYIADAATTADDLNRKLDVYSDQLFRQARWEVQRLRLEMVRDYRLDQAMPLAERAVKSAEQAVSTVDRLAPAIERTLGVAEGAPKLVAAEREIAVKSVHDEITRTLEQVTKERATASKEIHDALQAQANRLAVEGARISREEIDYVMGKVNRVVMIAMVVAIAVVVLVVLAVWHRRRAARLAN